MEHSAQGSDGFPLSKSDRLYRIHLLLDAYLNDQELNEVARYHAHLASVKNLSKRETIDHIEAVLRRLSWLYEHDGKLRNAHVARLRLVQLLRVLYTRKLPCTEADLHMMLDLTAPLLESIAPDGPVDYVMEYLKKNDLTPELCQSLRNFQANLCEGGSVASEQSLQQRLHVLLWLDEWEPLDPKRCWSECIRRDFRAMSGERRTTWRRLLKHIRSNLPARMPATWARDAELLLKDVGLEDFREQLGVWSAPFRSDELLPLSVAGSHVLRALIWYAAVSQDEQVKEYALWLLHVKWKQKRNTPKSMLALEVFNIPREELISRGLVKPLTPSPTPSILKNLVLNWSAIPGQFRLMLTRETESDEQLMLRATLLMYDSIYGQYFVAG